MQRQYYVYLLASESKTLYVGVTNDLEKRFWQHTNECGSAFAARYRINRLVHYEVYSHPYTAISREKQIKSWRRSKKVDLIEKQNPDWLDLSVDLGFRPLSER